MDQTHQNTSSEVEVVSPTPGWKTLLRQNSEKIGTLAEEVVLPMNQRCGQRSHVPEVILLRDVEAQDCSMSTMVVDRPPEKQQKHFPIFIVGISVIQVILMYNVDNKDLLVILGFDPHRRHEFWRLLTIMFVHIGLFHLWSNVIFQLILGIPLEIVHHWKRIAIIYVSSVIGGTMFISVLSPTIYAAGASAGIYGLLFSHLSTIILNWNEMDKKCCRLFWLLAFIFFDIGVAVEGERELEDDKEDGDSDGETNTSHAAHFGGALTGFLVSILVLKNFQSHPWEEKLQKIVSKILITLVVIILTINVLAWDRYLPEEWNFNYKHSYDVFLKRMIIESPKDSHIYKLCLEESDCKSMLDQYAFNGTVSSKPFLER